MKSTLGSEFEKPAEIIRKGVKREGMEAKQARLEEGIGRSEGVLKVQGMSFSQLRECPCINPKSTCIYHKKPGTNECFRPEGACERYVRWENKLRGMDRVYNKYRPRYTG